MQSNGNAILMSNYESEDSFDLSFDREQQEQAEQARMEATQKESRFARGSTKRSFGDFDDVQSQGTKDKMKRKVPKTSLVRQMTSKLQAARPQGELRIQLTKSKFKHSNSIDSPESPVKIRKLSNDRPQCNEASNMLRDFESTVAIKDQPRRSLAVTKQDQSLFKRNNKLLALPHLNLPIDVKDSFSQRGGSSKPRVIKEQFYESDDNTESESAMTHLDKFQQLESNEKFKKVMKISEKIEQMQPSDQDIEEVVVYLKQMKGLKDKFDHLNKFVTKRLIDCLECKFYSKGEYIFKKNEKPDVAYVVLYGKVIFLDVTSVSYLSGYEPISPDVKRHVSGVSKGLLSTKNKEDQAPSQITSLRRKTRLAKDNFTTVEEEKKVGECDEGTLIGDIAMLYPEKETRKLSGMAKTDCVFLILNKDAFDILIRVRRTSLVYSTCQDKLKKDRELLGQFIYETIPKLKEQFTMQKVVKNAHIIFQSEVLNILSFAILLQVQIKDKELIKEGDRSDKLYIIREGQCALFKTTYVKDMLGVPVKKEERLMNIEVGEIFGEDCLCFSKDNQYTVKATSAKVTLLVISYKDLQREYKRLIPSLVDFFEKRNIFLLQRISKLQETRQYEKNQLKSSMQRGSMNVFLLRDFKNQVNFADNKTKRKLQIIYMRKELQMQKETRAKLKLQYESERQQNQMFQNTASSYNTISSRQIPRMIETSPQVYISKVLSPQRAMKNQFGQLNQMKDTKSSNVTNLQQMKFRENSQSIQTFASYPKHHQHSSSNFEVTRAQQIMPMHLVKSQNNNTTNSTNHSQRGKRTYSQASLQNLTKGVNRGTGLGFRTSSNDASDDHLRSTLKAIATSNKQLSFNYTSQRFFDRRPMKTPAPQTK